MIRGVIVGIVKDNVDPEQMHRVLVEYPVSSGEGKVESTWARVCTPMGGLNRGLVILPDIGTEVALSFSYKSLTPYILGGLYNGGADKPEPYKNDDEKNNLRVFWSRNDHMIVFDDTEGKEKIQLGAKAPDRLKPESGIIWQTLDASEKTYSEYCGGNTSWTAMEKISVKCKTFELTAKANITMQGGKKVDRHAGGNMNFNASSLVNLAGSQVLRNCGVDANPMQALGGLSGAAGSLAGAAGGLAGAAGGLAGAAGGLAGAAGGLAGAAGGLAGAAGGLAGAAGGLAGAAGGLAGAAGGLAGAAGGLGGLASAAGGLGGIANAAGALGGIANAAGSLGNIANAVSGLGNIANAAGALGGIANAASSIGGLSEVANAVGNVAQIAGTASGIANAVSSGDIGAITNSLGSAANAAGLPINPATMASAVANGDLSSVTNAAIPNAPNLTNVTNPAAAIQGAMNGGQLNPPQLDSLIPTGVKLPK